MLPGGVYTHLQKITIYTHVQKITIFKRNAQINSTLQSTIKNILIPLTEIGSNDPDIS